ncbi:MAG: hypothetical protein JXR83_03025 [Deltaproteobacteria bacterium]|nr:hypothetical protein [Deltaproteobacteria bacterium]
MSRLQFGRSWLVLLALVLSVLGCNKVKEEEGSARRTVEVKPVDAAGVAVILLGDRRCTDRTCQTGPIVSSLNGVLPGLRVTQHDWSEPECKALFDSEGLRHLPAVLFEESVKQQPGYQKLSRFLVKTPKGTHLSLQIGATFDPRAEICDNKTDDTGDGLVDCADPTCKGKLVCRPEIPKKLDLFVMSQCPYGTMALDAMNEILPALDPSIDFNIHYIASVQGDGFNSLHGQPEVDENIRELCAIKHFAKNRGYMEYIWCRNRKIRDLDWKSCTGSKGIDAAVLEKCFTGEEGKALLREDIKLAEELNITASPTWLANNRFQFSGIAPEMVKNSFCSRNPGLSGCDKKLSEKSPRPEGACR